MTPLKKYVIFSIILHISILVIATVIGICDNTKKTFIVFGAHSARPSSIRYKTSKSATPFVKTGSGNHQGKNIKTGKKSSKAKQAKNTPKATTKKSNKQSAPSNKTKKQTLKQKKQAALPEPSPEPSTKNSKKKPKPAKAPEPEVEEELEEEKIEKKKPEPPVTSPEEEKTEEEQEIAGDNTSDETEAWPDTDEILSFNSDGNGEGDGEYQQNIKIYQTHIQKEVIRLWRPPLGVPKGTVCTILFIINGQGDVEKCEILKRSKMLIYDLSIMRVAKNFKFSRYLWNKKFTIDFKQ